MALRPHRVGRISGRTTTHAYRRAGSSLIYRSGGTVENPRAFCGFRAVAAPEMIADPEARPSCIRCWNILHRTP